MQKIHAYEDIKFMLSFEIFELLEIKIFFSPKNIRLQDLSLDLI